ncbi:MAG TPA: MFS transporter [Roseococcus sp.]|nr:MFS transporter [Roseococcus sp.]
MNAPTPFARLIAAATCAFAGVWMSTPLAAVLLAEAGVSPAMIGLWAATSWGAALCTAPLTPWLASLAGGAFRLHRFAAVAAMLALCGLATDPSLGWWYACAALLGMGSCLTWTTADAIAGAMAPPGREGRALGLYQTFVSAAIGGGPALLLLTGVRAEAFLAAAGVLALGLLLGTGLHDPAGTMPHRLHVSRARLLPELRVMAAPFGAAMLCGGLESSAASVFPVQGLALGMSVAAAAAIGVASGFGNVFAQYPVGRMADRFGTDVALVCCAVAVAVSALAWPWLANGPAVWPVLALWGGASGAIYTLGMIRAVRRFAGPARAIGIAGLNTAYLLGGALGAPAAGLALERLPGWGLSVLLAAVALGGGVALARAIRHQG